MSDDTCESYIMNCTFETRPGEDPLFEFLEGPGGLARIRLSSYAIVPLERVVGLAQKIVDGYDEHLNQLVAIAQTRAAVPQRLAQALQGVLPTPPPKPESSPFGGVRIVFPRKKR